MRNEIAEVTESFGKGQVGSSTMAHKRNPINFENTEGTFKRSKSEFFKVMDTLISEHQRDLVDSSVARDFPIVLITLQQQLNTLSRKNDTGIPFLSRISVNADACRKNFEESAKYTLAEPLYIALQMAGYKGDAHELVNHTLMPIAQKTNTGLFSVFLDLADKDDDLAEVYSKIPININDRLERAESYTGNSFQQAIKIAFRAIDVSRRLME